MLRRADWLADPRAVVATDPTGLGWATTAGLRLSGRTRAFYVPTDALQTTLDLRGRTLRFTVDVSRVPCSVMFSVSFLATDDPTRSYCSANTEPSCTEVRSRIAFQTRPSRMHE